MTQTEAEHRGTRDKNGLMARPVLVPWTCHRSGDCCRTVSVVTMTKAERDILEGRRAFARRALDYRPHEDERFVNLVADPCPFLGEQNQCLVYDVRPYNCRRFMCGRVDVEKESYEMVEGSMGCLNFMDRITTSRRFLEHFKAHERQHKDWARDHGWTSHPLKVVLK